eukprot:m.60312 g.60312  ORF g.60312 m.60312 type:complete len:236 (-) comp11808_c0_seq1:320-1027(-)
MLVRATISLSCTLMAPFAPMCSTFALLLLLLLFFVSFAQFLVVVMMAEVVHHFIPRLVELHNYSPASSSKQKADNWHTLNAKVFKKLGLTVPENVVNGIVTNKAGVVEVVLSNLRVKIEQYQQRQAGVDPIDARPNWGALEPKRESPSKGKSRNGKKKPPAPPPNAFESLVNGATYDDIDDPAQALMDKDQSIMDYQETVEILQVKVRKLEQLVKLKDKRIDELQRRLQAYEGGE